MNRMIALTLLLAAPGLGLAATIHEAADKGDAQEVRRVLAGAPQAVNATNAVGYTPLHIAAMRGHFAVAEVLVASNAVLDSFDKDGVAPVALAASTRQLGPAFSNLLQIEAIRLAASRQNGDMAATKNLCLSEFLREPPKRPRSSPGNAASLLFSWLVAPVSRTKTVPPPPCSSPLSTRTVKCCVSCSTKALARTGKARSATVLCSSRSLPGTTTAQRLCWRPVPRSTMRAPAGSA